MNVGSLFSGIGGLDLGLHRAGWQHVFLCESDEWRRGVLRERFPGVPVYDDVREVASGGGRGRPGHLGRDGARPEPERNGSPLPVEPAAVDLLCGGFPCQDVSVAGRRAGLAGERSGLFHEFARVADAFRPRWLLVENVPGLLSSNGGRDFGSVLGTLADLGYGVAWRVLDSRFFGVPQRRRRVFIVGALAESDPRAAAVRAGEVLAVGSRCPRHSQAGGEARPGVAVASALGTGNGGAGGWRIGAEEAAGNQLVTVAPALVKRYGKGADSDASDAMVVAGTLKGQRGRGGGGIGPEETLVVAPLSHGSNPNSNMAGRRREDDENLVAYALRSGGKPGQGYPMLRDGASVRRLTPTECERLQALPDDWTRVPDSAPDSRRYAALGDAVTASVAYWIGLRMRRAA